MGLRSTAPVSEFSFLLATPALLKLVKIPSIAPTKVRVCLQGAAVLACAELGYTGGFFRFGDSGIDTENMPPPWISSARSCADAATIAECATARAAFGDTATCGFTMELFCSNAAASMPLTSWDAKPALDWPETEVVNVCLVTLDKQFRQTSGGCQHVGTSSITSVHETNVANALYPVGMLHDCNVNVCQTGWLEPCNTGSSR